VKLVGCVVACGGAGFSCFLVGFRFLCLAVEFQLDWAFDVVAEFSAFVPGESFGWHDYLWVLLPCQRLIRLVFPCWTGNQRS